MTEMLLLLAMPERVQNRYAEAIRAAFPQVKLHVAGHASAALPAAAGAEVLASFGTMVSDELLRGLPRLRWIQALGTGVDGIVDRPSLRKDVILTNMRGFQSAPMSEAALLAMLALARGLPRVVRNQAAARWERFPAATLWESTVAIVGVGSISAALAPRCKALGMRVLGVSSTPRELPGFDAMRPMGELLQAVAEADYVVLLTPYSRRTHHLVDARVLAAMKPSGFLVNLARGGIVDEAALLEVLRAGRIAGAALDVFATEPLPAEHPFWNLPNVLVTPHLGGFFERYPDHALPVIEENLRRFLAGRTQDLKNIVERP